MSPTELRCPLSPPRVSRPLAGSCLVLALCGCAPPAEPARAPAAPSEAAPAAAEAAPAAAESPAAVAPPSTKVPAASSASSEARDGPRDARGKDEIRAVISANRDKVRACYDAALKNNPGIHGDLVVGFVINPDGSVKSAEVSWAESELHVPELDSCAVDVLHALKFPPSSRGLESKVNYPFNFNPGKP